MARGAGMPGGRVSPVRPRGHAKRGQAVGVWCIPAVPEGRTPRPGPAGWPPSLGLLSPRPSGLPPGLSTPLRFLRLAMLAQDRSLKTTRRKVGRSF
jgi:hypothetical protein